MHTRTHTHARTCIHTHTHAQCRRSTQQQAVAAAATAVGRTRFPCNRLLPARKSGSSTAPRSSPYRSRTTACPQRCRRDHSRAGTRRSDCRLPRPTAIIHLRTCSVSTTWCSLTCLTGACVLVGVALLLFESVSFNFTNSLRNQFKNFSLALSFLFCVTSFVKKEFSSSSL